MFSFIVSGNSTAWETDQLMRIDCLRFKEYSPGPEARAVDLANPASLLLLAQSPALLMYERGTEGPEADIVRYGMLRNIHVVEDALTFRFSEEGRFTRAVITEYSDRLGIKPFEHGRTHWAIKEASLPTTMLNRLQRTYDVVLSFSSLDRAFVEQVAHQLQSQGITVFYDAFEAVVLWGKDLAEYLDIVYSRSGKYCVFFISNHYSKSMWTRLERRAAFARALQSRHEYILPARFDDTELDGLSPTIACITLGDKTPESFANLLLRKIRGID